MSTAAGILRSSGSTSRAASSAGYCEEACPTYAIQLTTDFEMGEYVRQNLVYEKEDLLISGPGKYPGDHFYKEAGLAVGVRTKARGRTKSHRWM